MGTLFEDVRYGLRLLAKKPSFTAVAMLTLALGIGANTAVFSIVDAVLLRPLPYKDSDRLVAVWESEIRQLGSSRIFDSFRDFEEWKRDSQSFEELEACTWALAGQTLTWHGAAQRVLAIPVTEGFFSLLGARVAQGRTFEAPDLKNGCTIVLGHRFWQSRLGSASDIVGGSLMLDDKVCTVVGIAPKGFEFYPMQTDLWTLITSESEYAKHPLDSAVGVFGRLKPGVSRASALAELSVLHRRVVNEAPAGSWVREIVPVVYDLQEAFTWMAGRNLRTALLVLLATVALVLLIACVNVANLLLGRASERQKELAIRAALGSGRSRLIRQLLTESILLAILGAVFGICLAIGGVRYFRAVNPVELPPGNPVTVNVQVLAFTVFLAILTGLLFGLVPAWKASRLDLNEVLKETGRGVGEGC
jgi:putative ABC transport system permease protein